MTTEYTEYTERGGREIVGLMYEDETYAVKGAVFEVYKTMGAGFLEAVYQECLEEELRVREIPFVSQVEIKLDYKGKPLRQFYKADIVCYDKIILELKAVSNLLPEHSAQSSRLHGRCDL